MHLTKEELLHHNPQRGIVDLAKQRQADSAEIAAQIEAFKARGGKIKIIEPGVSADYNPIRKEPYNNSLKNHNRVGLKTL